MKNQLEFSFEIHSKENNSESQSILNDQKERLSKNCTIIFEALLRGEKLSGLTITRKYKMLEYRRRIKDIREFLKSIESKIIIQEKILPTGSKVWWIKK